MKEPSEHYVDDDHAGPVPYCEEDEQEWPCTTWQKWTASKDYRIALLETRMTDINLQLAGQRKQINALDSQSHQDHSLLWHGVFPAVTDLIKAPASLETETTRNLIDMPSMRGCGEVVVAGPSEFNVTYTSLGGVTRCNGELVSREFSSGSPPGEHEWLRILIRCLTQGKPVDFKKRPVPVWAQAILGEEIT